MKTYYNILNIEKNASSEEIKSAYRVLASRYHPDVNSDPESAEIFKLLNRAYTTLSDSDKRVDYDRLISVGTIYRTHQQDDVIESSGAFSAYSNTLANIVFFAFLTTAITAFTQWLVEINDIFWNITTIISLLLGGFFGLLLGFQNNFNTKEIFTGGYRYFRIFFWLMLIASFSAFIYQNIKVIQPLLT